MNTSRFESVAHRLGCSLILTALLGCSGGSEDGDGANGTDGADAGPGGMTTANTPTTMAIGVIIS